ALAACSCRRTKIFDLTVAGIPGSAVADEPVLGQTVSAQSADPARARMESRRGPNEACELGRAAARRAQQEFAGGDEARDRRERRKQPFEKTFGHAAHTGGAPLILAASQQEIARFLDKARLRRPPATKQENSGAARRLQ